MLRHVHQRDQNAKEAEDVHDQQHRLGAREELAADEVDGQGEAQRQPADQGGLVGLGIVGGVSEDGGALDHAACQESAGGKGALPAEDGEPAYSHRNNTMLLARAGN
jgi:hypothetical protein